MASASVRGNGVFAGRDDELSMLRAAYDEALAANSPVNPPGPVSPAFVPETRIFRIG